MLRRLQGTSPLLQITQPVVKIDVQSTRYVRGRQRCAEGAGGAGGVGGAQEHLETETNQQFNR